ncbi:hypothetical protein PHBOTO_004932 [Pseudozyma hubeiensis]|nr:hypothetical protein PHBOTO_004932 [Pseudozyma hubeiensis]
MPPTKSSKSGKASKAAKAILHPKSTIAAAKSSHTQRTSMESSSSRDAATSADAPASTIRKAPSSSSISCNSTKPLPSAASSTGSPASVKASLPTVAPAPTTPQSVLSPAVNTDILSMKKQAMERVPPLLPASLPPAIARASTGYTSEARAAAAPSPKAADATAPYTINDSSTVSASIDPRANGSEFIEAPLSESTTKYAKENEAFAAEVAAVISEAPGTSSPHAVAADAPAKDVVSDSVADLQKVESASPPSAEQQAPALSTEQVSNTAAAAARVATFTPPELTRLQHNTFASRPSDASRASLRDLDPTVLPTPLRPIDRHAGIVRAPSHVIIFGWMDAPIRLVAKYAQPYTVLFPDATVLIQLSDGKSYLAREDVRRKQLQRVIAEISASAASVEDKNNEAKDVGDSTVTLIDHSEARSATSEDGADQAPQQGGFVIHSFSDGGAGNLALFLDEMTRREATSPRVHSLIMDSSPGKSNPKSGSVAFTMHLANRPRLRAIVRFFVYIGLYCLKIWTKVTGQPGRGELMRKRLNSLRSWSWVTASYTPKSQAEHKSAGASAEAEYPPRMYMYTKADKLIPWQFVEEHAEQLASLRKIQPRLVQMEKHNDREALLSAVEAKEQVGSADYKVELRRWDTPPHCSIGRSDFEGYWAAVMDFYVNVLSRK